MSKQMKNLVRDALLVEEQSASDAGMIAFMARVLVQVTLPHRMVKDPTSNQELFQYSRENGTFRMSMLAEKEIGLPYGIYPRLLLAWVVTEALRQKSREIEVTSSISQLMAELGLSKSGGKHGPLGRFKDQTKRLLDCTFKVSDDNVDRWRNLKFGVTAGVDMFWNNVEGDGKISIIKLNQEFFDEITHRPVPIDMRVLKAAKSPLEMDIYTWLTYRMSYLNKDVEIPWGTLALQFGSHYKEVKDFKKNFKSKLKTIRYFYKEANISEGQRGLILHPSRTHIKKK